MKAKAPDKEEAEKRKTILFISIAAVILVLFSILFHAILGGPVNCENVLPGARDGCYLNKARETGDITICDRIVSNITRELCIENFRGALSYEFCDRYPEELKRDFCFRELAMESGNHSYCQYISDVRRMDDCYYFMAMNASDPNICYYSSEPQRIYCANKVHIEIAFSKNDPFECQKLEGTDENMTSSLRDSCLFQLARANNNTLACNLIANPELKTQCRQPQFGEELCQSFSEVEARNTCYLSIAVQSKDPELCTKITSLSWRNTCFLNVARTVKDSKICERITSSSLRELCRRVAG